MSSRKCFTGWESVVHELERERRRAERRLRRWQLGTGVIIVLAIIVLRPSSDGAHATPPFATLEDLAAVQGREGSFSSVSGGQGNSADAGRSSIGGQCSGVADELCEFIP